ncbi:oxidoreductase [Halobacteriales archaeon QS_1_68_20]|nr:MAG: oxidoreductase [Halobacteriales archaeon QS_1_68_20]
MAVQTVLITGCSSGIGRATALAFEDEGWQVYATSRDEDDLTDPAERGCATDSLDVTDTGEVRRVIKRIIAEEGRLDCVVSNAGYGQFGPLEELEESDLAHQFDVNTFGFHRLVRRAMPHMRDQGDGTMIAVSSPITATSAPGTGAYAGSKAALEAMCDSLRPEVDADGVDVVIVQPGIVDTNFLDRMETERISAEESDYDWIQEMYDDATAIGMGGPFSISPDRVASTIVDAACATDPEPRYQVGQLARLINYGRFLPARWRDLLFGVARRLA